MTTRRVTQPAPRILWVIAGLGLAVFVVLPLAALLQRAPWSTMIDELRSAQVRDALLLSLVCSLGAATLATVFGVPLAWVLARRPFPGRAVVQGLVMLPMVLPPVVGGVALLLAFGRRGILGRPLDELFGLRLPFTTGGAILAETFVALPFLVLAVEAALRSTDQGYEDAAATLGAGRRRTFIRVTMPMIAPSLAAGIALAWARALGEFGATITFAGNLQGRTQTVPLAVYVALESRPDAAIALSIVLLALSLTVLVLAGRRVLAGSGPFGNRRAGDRR